ncbi:hypothetical protein [Nitrobacter winogradskyi]|uniref:Uncharacterized protein n=2 Tax=Nitrobacter winogradskyi TaxID=913 RepID=A0ACC6AGX2_NITWI|nr:hypothetical protein [Nitrobacter winogradskyi]MCP1998753.1 hypothetical protein [Nitrobacter winogradskyi]GEC14322.1 hypothetical protein NWI01_02140 [Nitrobacter winogradskyi]
MPSHHDAWLRRQQSRWLQPDGGRWIRPDAARFLPPGADVEKAFPALAPKYNPNQPRVPAGNSDGGNGRMAAQEEVVSVSFRLRRATTRSTVCNFPVIGRRLKNRRKFRLPSASQRNDRSILSAE